MKGQKNRIFNTFLAIWLIAMFVCSSVFTDKAAADDMEAVGQIFFGYIAGGVGFLLGGCAGFMGGGGTVDERIGTGLIGGGLATVFASSTAIYTIGEEDGSFGWTFAGALAPPLIGAGIGGIGDRISGNDDWWFTGYFNGLLLTPISATIAYQLTKKGNEPHNVTITAPMIRFRF